MRVATAAMTATALAMSVVTASAFCGFFVNGSNKKMFADATQVVLMRSGTRTVLSMKNDYRGPLEDFAMVVPVPAVLKDTDVRVLPKTVFERIDSLGSPRLVEYWEQDPCPPPPPKYDYPERAMKKSSTIGLGRMGGGGVSSGAPSAASRPSMDEEERTAVPPVLGYFSADPPTLTAGVETQVTWTISYANQPYPEPSCTIDQSVGRVRDGLTSPLKLDASTTFTVTCVNSAGKSAKQIKFNVGLNDWLKLNNYTMPEGAEPLLRPYVETGMKFFVAKVDPTKVAMVDGRGELSPLRVQYDSEEFSLPIRLGLANSSGKQDLIVNILSPDKRFEVSNYKNAFIPTNIDVKPVVKERFSEFYAALFDKTVAANPGAVITEYAWTARSTPGGRGGRGRGPLGVKCDPCPPNIPQDSDMLLLGADVVGGQMQKGAYVLTRLHARYGKKDMKDDLRFREAKAVVGGREIATKDGLEYGARDNKTASESFFQARYAIRYTWTGPMKCKNPQRYVWGGPPDGRATQLIAASNVAYAPRGKLQLASVIKRNLWEIGFKKAATPKPPATTVPAPTTPVPKPGVPGKTQPEK